MFFVRTLKIHGPGIPVRTKGEDPAKIAKKLILDMFGIHLSKADINQCRRITGHEYSPILIRLPNLFFIHLTNLLLLVSSMVTSDPPTSNFVTSTVSGS